MSADASLKEHSFESLLKRLEAITDSLASDSDGLEEAVKKYETGVALANECLSRLDKAEQHVIQLKEGMEAETV